MFKRILVPLDGSARSEQALPLAAHIAHTYSSSLALTRIVDILEIIGASSIQAAALTNEIREIQEKEAQEYLQRIYNARELEHLERAIEVHSGDKDWQTARLPWNGYDTSFCYLSLQDSYTLEGMINMAKCLSWHINGDLSHIIV